MARNGTPLKSKSQEVNFKVVVSQDQAENLVASGLGGGLIIMHFMELGMHNCVLHIEWLLLNTCSF